MSAARVLTEPGAGASLMKHRLGWCIALGLVTGVAALVWFGVRPWTIAFAILMLVCPAAIFWLAWYAHRSFPQARGEKDPDDPHSKRTGGT